MSPQAVRRTTIAISAVLVGLAVWTRSILLTVGLWGDEAYSAYFYVARGPTAIFRPESYLLNNHVLFSFGEWLGSKVLGSSELVLRLGAVIPALVAIVLLAIWCNRRFGRAVALTVSLLLIASPIHLLYSTQARGYGLAILVAVGLLVAGVWVAEAGSRRSWVWLAITAAGGICTLSHLAFLYGGHMVALLRNSGRRVGVFVNGVIVSAVVALFYRGLLGEIISQTTGQGLLRTVDNRPSKTIQLTGFIADPATLLYSDWTRLFGLWPEWLIVGSFTVLVGLGSWALWRRRDSEVMAHLFVSWLVFMIVLFIFGSIPQERFLSLMIGPLAVIIGIGLADASRALLRSVPLRLAVAVAIGSALLVSMVGDALAWTEPWENYREAVHQANQYEGDVYSNRTVGAAGFLWYDSTIEAVEDVSALCGLAGPFVLIDFPFRPQELPSCISEVASERIEIDQRHTRGPIVLWVIPGSG